MGAARDERNRLGEEGQRQERLYAHNVRLLQEAATHLEQKLVKKQEVCKVPSINCTQLILFTD